jgi:hypothetical protein
MFEPEPKPVVERMGKTARPEPKPMPEPEFEIMGGLALPSEAPCDPAILKQPLADAPGRN